MIKYECSKLRWNMNALIKLKSEVYGSRKVCAK